LREHKTGVLELPRDCTTSLWATTRGPRKPPHIGPAPAGAGASCVPPTCPPSSSGKAVRGWPGARHIGAGCRCDWASTAPLWRCRHLRHQARGLAVRGASARPHNGPGILEYTLAVRLGPQEEQGRLSCIVIRHPTAASAPARARQRRSITTITIVIYYTTHSFRTHPIEPHKPPTPGFVFRGCYRSVVLVVLSKYAPCKTPRARRM
jgi:hypothetical protein